MININKVSIAALHLDLLMLYQRFFLQFFAVLNITLDLRLWAYECTEQ